MQIAPFNKGSDPFEMHDGNSPVRSLLFNPRAFKFVNVSIDDGIVPVMLLLFNLNFVNPVRFVIDSGIAPVRFLPLQSNSTILPRSSSTMIPSFPSPLDQPSGMPQEIAACSRKEKSDSKCNCHEEPCGPVVCGVAMMSMSRIKLVSWLKGEGVGGERASL